MTGSHPLRFVARLAVMLLAASLLAVISRGAWAAPLPQADALVAEIQQQVAEIRGLEVRSETASTLLPRSALVNRLARELNTDKAVREFLTSQMLLEVLGVTKRGYDLRDLQQRLLEEQTLAVYDFTDRTIYVAAEVFDGGDTDVNGRLVLAHELTHALQDQHFTLQRILPAEPENSDVAMAGRALAEGDAMLTMRIWGRQFLRPGDKRNLGNETVPVDPVLDDAPLLVQGEALFPYDAGWMFAQQLHHDGGYDAVNRAFARPPRSTEQILHPEKYLAGESPVSVTIAPLERELGGTWKTLRTDVFGELVLRLLLEPSVGLPAAESAAAGWGGDAYTILEDGEGRRIVALMTVWDTDGDAAEVFNAFSESIAALYGADQRRTITQAGLGRWTIPEYQVQALKTDKTVRIIYAPSVAALEQVDALISAARIGPSGPVAPPPTAPPAPVIPATPTPRPATATPINDEDGGFEELPPQTETLTPVPATSGTPRPVTATPVPGDDELDEEGDAETSVPAFAPAAPATGSTPRPSATPAQPDNGGTNDEMPNVVPANSAADD
jgi:hypothetical protein